jgi:hypothetical protein
MGGPLSAYPVPPDCLAAAGVVDRPAYDSADTRLQLPRERQCRAEPLVLDDRTGCQRLDLVEHPERQRDT